MIRILSIETSTQVCSVALHVDGKLVAINELRIGQAHATKLAVLIEQISVSADVSLSALDAVAISSGPGSYTGLRIGTSTAKGICLASDIPLISVPTLEAMAIQAKPYNVLNASVCPMIDARRMEVYCRLSDHNGNELSATEAKVIDESAFSNELAQGPILFYGDGAAKCKSVMLHKNAHFIEDIQASANQVGVLAFRKFQTSSFESLLEFEPIYLKEFMIKHPQNLRNQINLFSCYCSTMETQPDIVNRVANSGLITFNLEEFRPAGDRVLIDIKDQLYQGLILKEKDFRAFVKENDWTFYQDKYVAITCSADAIIPVWAFMLIGIALQPHAKKVSFGSLEELEREIFNDIFHSMDWNIYNEKKVVLKGCSNVFIPTSVYVEATVQLKRRVKTLSFGEPCSTVPLFKKKD